MRGPIGRIVADMMGVASLFTAGRADRNPYYRGPASDHFDGVRFFNPGLPWSQSSRQAYQALRKTPRAVWPTDRRSPFRDSPPATVDGPGLRVVSVGHTTLLIQVAGLNILTDPLWSERCSPVRFAGPRRACAPGVAFDDLPKIDVVLLSHNHYDHMDVATLLRLAERHDPRMIMPLGNDAILRAYDPDIRAEAYDWGDRIHLDGEAWVTLLPAYHWSARGLKDRRMALWSAFAIDAGAAGKIYFAGDTGLGPGDNFRAARETCGPFRLAILPIGAYEPRWFMKSQHMNPDDAATAFELLGAESAVGCHWGTFQLTAEAIDAPVDDLAKALDAKGIAPERFRALMPGEVWQA